VSVVAQPRTATPPPSNRPLSRKNLVATITTGYLPIAVATLVIVLPLIWMILSSFKTPNELLTQHIDVLPDSLAPTNYSDAARTVPFGRLFLNSVLVTVVGAGIKLVLGITTAYALVFVRFPFKRVIFALILVTLMVPPQVSLVPNYVLITGLGGADTYWGIILPGLATGFGTFLLRQQFMTLPGSLLEAAELDGASHWQRLTRVVVPISVPAIATVALVNIVYEWNEYLWPLVIVSQPHMMTLPVGLTLLRNSESSAASYGILMAGTVFVIVPVLIVFAAFQRFIVSGLTQCAVKD
jgi:sn-glycerol 3-phosphate transport system permease protein